MFGENTQFQKLFWVRTDLGSYKNRLYLNFSNMHIVSFICAVKSKMIIRQLWKFCRLFLLTVATRSFSSPFDELIAKKINPQPKVNLRIIFVKPDVLWREPMAFAKEQQRAARKKNFFDGSSSARALQQPSSITHLGAIHKWCRNILHAQFSARISVLLKKCLQKWVQWQKGCAIKTHPLDFRTNILLQFCTSTSNRQDHLFAWAQKMNNSGCMRPLVCR